MAEEQESGALRPLKVLVATPTTGEFKAGCTWSVSRAIAHFAGLEYDGEKTVDWEVIRTSNLPDARTKLMARAQANGATHLLFVDSDMKIPEDAIAVLINHNLPVVGANYPTKELDARPTAYRDDDVYVGPVWTRPEDTGCEQVAHIGFGCTLIDMRVFDKLDLPYFAIEPVGPDYLLSVTEDVYFCRKANAAGITIAVDHDLSKRVSHIGDWEYTVDYAWKAQQAKLECYAGIGATTGTA